MMQFPKVNWMPKAMWIGVLLLTHIGVSGQTYPNPKPGRLIHDFANVLPDREEALLESQLRALNDTTSIQISVVTLATTGGDDIALFNTELAHRWGVGQADTDNGVQILVAADDRKVNITTGYGSQEYLTDAMSKRIIEQYMIPEFKKGNYAGGIQNAITAIDDLMHGQFEGRAPRPKSVKRTLPGGLFILIALILMFIWRRGGRGGGGRGGRRSLGQDIATAILLSSMGRSNHGGFGGGFGGGSGGFGGGGFGGFGGGGFGGGGASGSW